MILEQPNCPECGQPAAFVSEYLPIVSMIRMSEDGHAEFTGSILESPFGRRTPDLDGHGQSCVCCSDEHFWRTHIK